MPRGQKRWKHSKRNQTMRACRLKWIKKPARFSKLCSEQTRLNNSPKPPRRSQTTLNRWSNGPNKPREPTSIHPIPWPLWLASKSAMPKNNSINCKTNCKRFKARSISLRSVLPRQKPWRKGNQPSRTSKELSIRWQSNWRAAQGTKRGSTTKKVASNSISRPSRSNRR